MFLFAKFSALVGVSYIIWKVLDFIFILNLSCYTSMYSSQRALQIYGKLFFKFQTLFQIFCRKLNFFIYNTEAWILIKLQWICLNELYKLMKSFFKISNFWNFCQKLKNSKKNSKEWILIKLQCVIYQWICLNNLYKLMKSFFQISFWNFSRKQKILAKNPKIFKRIVKREYW